MRSFGCYKDERGFRVHRRHAKSPLTAINSQPVET
jgi:hypothetical protein